MTVAAFLAALALTCCPAEALPPGRLALFTSVATTGAGKFGGGGGPPVCSDSLDFSDACNSALIAVVL